MFLRTRENVSCTVPLSVFRKMEELAKTGQKIQAIKELRMATGLGLKDSKDIVEQTPQFAHYW